MNLELVMVNNWSERTLKRNLRHFVKDLEYPPTKKEMTENGPCSVSIYINQFGSWNAALRAIDEYPPTSPNRDELLDALLDLSRELGRTPTAEEVNEAGIYNVHRYVVEFSSWEKAIKECGLSTDEIKEPTGEELIDALRDLSEELGRPASRKEMNQSGEYTSDKYEKEFGRWSMALNIADIPPKSNSFWNQNSDSITFPSEDDLIDDLVHISQKISDKPYKRDINIHGEFEVKTYIEVFGSFQSALEKAGFEPDSN